MSTDPSAPTLSDASSEVSFQAPRGRLGDDDGPSLAEMHRAIAMRKLGEGFADEAFQELARACQLAPMSARVASSIVSLAMRAKISQPALTLLAQGVDEAEGDDRIAVLRHLARLARKIDEPERGREALVRLLFERPHDRRARAVLNALLERAGRWEELDASLEKETKDALGRGALLAASRSALRRARMWDARLGDQARAALRYMQAALYAEKARDFELVFSMRLLWLHSLHRSSAPQRFLEDAVAVTYRAGERVGQAAKVTALVIELGLPPPKTRRSSVPLPLATPTITPPALGSDRKSSVQRELLASTDEAEQAALGRPPGTSAPRDVSHEGPAIAPPAPTPAPTPETVEVPEIAEVPARAPAKPREGVRVLPAYTPSPRPLSAGVIAPRSWQPLRPDSALDQTPGVARSVGPSSPSSPSSPPPSLGAVASPTRSSVSGVLRAAPQPPRPMAAPGQSPRSSPSGASAAPSPRFAENASGPLALGPSRPGAPSGRATPLPRPVPSSAGVAPPVPSVLTERPTARPVPGSSTEMTLDVTGPMPSIEASAAGPQRSATEVPAAPRRERSFASSGSSPGRRSAMERLALLERARSNPLEPMCYRLLAEYFDGTNEPGRADLMRELSVALEGGPQPPLRAPPLILTEADRVALKHPSLRADAGELIGLVGRGLLALYPTPAPDAGTEVAFELESGPGARPAAEALSAAVRILGLKASAAYLSAADGPPFSLVYAGQPRLLVGTAAIRRALEGAELRFFAGRALFTQFPEMVPLRLIRREALARALAVVSEVARGQDESTEGRLLRDALPPTIWERVRALVSSLGTKLDVGQLADGARHTANRAGLVVCGGVGASLAALKAKQALQNEVTELVRFAASERYLQLRARYVSAPPTP